MVLLSLLPAQAAWCGKESTFWQQYIDTRDNKSGWPSLRFAVAVAEVARFHSNAQRAAAAPATWACTDSQSGSPGAALTDRTRCQPRTPR
eukprot:COSAG06_NODE_3774_length_4919_cov_10.651660_7_plen_90_part_00